METAGRHCRLLEIAQGSGLSGYGNLTSRDVLQAGTVKRSATGLAIFLTIHLAMAQTSSAEAAAFDRSMPEGLLDVVAGSDWVYLSMLAAAAIIGLSFAGIAYLRHEVRRKTEALERKQKELVDRLAVNANFNALVAQVMPLRDPFESADELRVFANKVLNSANVDIELAIDPRIIGGEMLMSRIGSDEPDADKREATGRYAPNAIRFMGDEDSMDAVAASDLSEIRLAGRLADHGRVIVRPKEATDVSDAERQMLAGIAVVYAMFLEHMVSHTMLQSILDTMPVSLCVIDRTGTVIFVNEEWREFGRNNDGGSQGVGLGQNYIDVARQAAESGVTEAAAIVDGFKAMVRGGASAETTGFAVEYERQTPEELRWFQARFQPLTNSLDFWAAAVVHIDVTDLKEAEAKLRHTQRDETIRQLTAGICHDFNNMLYFIMGSAEHLIDQLADRPEAQEIVKEILDASEQSSSLTNNLMAYARQQSLEPRVFYIDAFVASIEPMVVRTMPEDIRLSFKLDASAFKIRADPAELQSAILNLVLNAKGAISSGGEIKVKTGIVSNVAAIDNGNADLDPKRTYVFVSVSDDGVGIPADILDRVTEPFFTTKKDGGNGMGLSMVSGFAVQSGGALRIESTVGRGTEIVVYLPTSDKKINLVDALSGADAEPVPQEANEGSPARIHVVEDSKFVRNMIIRNLTSEGFDVTSSENGKDALDYLTDHIDDVDLVISDVIMPGGIMGTDLVSRIQNMSPGKPYLLLSGYSEEDARDRTNISTEEILRKPIKKEQLLRAVRNALSERDARR